MNALMYFGISIAILYVFLFGYLFPKTGTTYDLFSLRLDLYPHWMKYISLVLFLVFVVLIIVIDEFTEEWASILIVSTNLCLFLLVFSKEKFEDEFSEQLRFKSFTYSFLTFLISAGVFGIVSLGNIEIFIPNLLFIQILIGVSLAFSLIYFYYTKYRSQKITDNTIK